MFNLFQFYYFADPPTFLWYFQKKKNQPIYFIQFLVFIYNIFRKKLDKVFSNRDREGIDRSNTIGDQARIIGGHGGLWLLLGVFKIVDTW